MTTITFAVDGPEWDSLYEDPEDKNSHHRVHEGVTIEAQLNLWPNLILYHWNKRTLIDELAFLGFDPTRLTPERSIVSLKAGSNLYLVSGIARQVVRRSWATDSKKQRIYTLLDCGLPVVISEDVKESNSSAFLEREGDCLVAICLLFGSIAFSGVPFRTPVTCMVKKITPLKIVPRSTILEAELQPGQVVPTLRISYHGEQTNTAEFLNSDKRLSKRQG
ncbi:MAG TPA: hypothetical protein VGS11_07965 [Candidatus Bathyarchaeia archaeon]|nr:hypothetical protein [Candidatus Bathyarchaeia archaeon]